MLGGASSQVYAPSGKVERAADSGTMWKSIFGRKREQAPPTRPYEDQRCRENEAGQVRGRHYVDWVPTLNELRSAGRDDEALELLLDIIDAAERAAVVSGREPAPGYTERTAVIYRRRGDFASEVAIIERWQAACPPERRGPGATQGRLADRLVKARELLARQ